MKKKSHYLMGITIGVVSALAITANSRAGEAKNGFSFCEKALKQLPIVKQDNKIEQSNVLDFVHFTADGKVEAQADPSIAYTTTDEDSGVLTKLGFDVPAQHCNRLAERLHTCTPSEAHTEKLSFTYQNGEVKDVTVQHFANGAWFTDKLTFLHSGDGSSCYVQHMSSNLLDPDLNANGQALNDTTTEFDLETCKLAHDMKNVKSARDAVLRAGGLAKFSQCNSRFAKAAMAHYYKDNPESDASYHVVPAASGASSVAGSINQ